MDRRLLSYSAIRNILDNFFEFKTIIKALFTPGGLTCSHPLSQTSLYVLIKCDNNDTRGIWHSIQLKTIKPEYAHHFSICLQ